MRLSAVPYSIQPMDEQARQKSKEPQGKASGDEVGPVASATAGLEGFEVAAGGWEASWVVVFYAAVATVLLATFRVIPWSASLAGIAAVFLSIMAIASSSRRLLVEGEGLALEITRFWLSRTKPLPPMVLRGLQVVESRRSRQWEGREPPQRDLSYFIYVELLMDKGKVRVFRSSLTAPPGRNRSEALRVAEELSRLTGHPAEHVMR